MSHRSFSFYKRMVFILCLLPALLLLEGVLNDRLGSNPIEALVRQSGDWTLRFLFITLSISPLRKLTGQSYWIRLRRMLGLYTFFYASLHVSLYIGLDKFLYWDEIVEDIFERPFITIGLLSFLLLIPLAVTSTQKMIRRLGKNWLRLHRMIYLISITAVLHFYMMVKADTQEPWIYIFILTLLLAFRLPLPIKIPLPWRKGS
ncbi:MAG: sulfoxide reductase heme-binding subunit YedZ [Gammaproteobacteria bacterium]|nr:sulfoxide reductase heme-binding subunit YedZ [Gammaproteobacteria bacterium]